MDRVWLKSYPPDVPAEVEPAQLRSLKQLLEQTCARHAARVAFVQMGTELSYGKLDELTRAFAAWLQQAGFRKGDRIAVMLPNTLQYPIVLFGALRAGLIVVNTNPLYTAPELLHQLSDSGATAIVVLENFARVLEQVLPRTQVKRVLVTAVGDFLKFPKSHIVNYVVRRVRKQVPRWSIPAAIPLKSAVAAGLGLPLAPVDVGPDDLAFLQYTGGTTGVAKGAMLSHGNVSINVLQAQAWLGKRFENEPAVLITAIPLYHVFALSANCLLFARLGWKNVLIINPRDLRAMIADLRRHPFKFISGVNTLFNALLHAPGFERLDFSQLKVTLGGGMAVQATVAQRWKEVTGCVLTQAWGRKRFENEPAVLITAIPLYHVFALSANCLLFARLGWKNVLIINPRDLRAMIADLRRHPFKFISGVNTLFNALLHAPGFERLDFSQLKVTLGGGMAVQATVAQRWKEVTGCVLTQAWGLTETSPAACINPTGEPFNGSIGLPIPSTEVAIKDDDGRDLELGKIGEICVRGPQVMRGYWNRPDETAKVMLPGGWLRTGDVGHMDARGFVYIEDRKKDMILVSGFNVYPNEVEAVAATHPGVLEAAAVAQPDEHSGEVVALFVVRKDPALSERDIIEHSRKSLAGYKVPKHVYFRSELPKSNVGKILRKALREELGRA
ncbi:MAG: long-chain-fatty-acid--CoA ligase [Gammaproteobacteria bacterium]|nr:MAG: long-chain-fatty-acid--CoA ligase [Gammaproteobacteria bacterium]